MTFSSAVIPLKSCRFWKVRATPARAAWKRLPTRQRRAAEQQRRPRWACRARRPRSPRVLLPEPLGPMSPWTGRTRTVSVTPSTAFTPPK